MPMPGYEYRVLETQFFPRRWYGGPSKDGRILDNETGWFFLTRGEALACCVENRLREARTQLDAQRERGEVELGLDNPLGPFLVRLARDIIDDCERRLTHRA